MIQVLESTEATSEPFERDYTFIVFLDTYTDGWYVEYAVYKENPSEMNWKRWHNQPLQQHGELSYVIVYGDADLRFRLNSGTQGATAVTITPKGVLFR